MILKKTLLFFFFFYKSDYISDDGDGGKNSWYMVYGADGNVFPNNDHDKPQKALLKVFLPISSDRQSIDQWWWKWWNYGGLGIYYCSFLPAESKSMRCL